MYIIINRGSGEIYERMEIAEVAFIVHGEQDEAECASDIRWSLKRTGRWDRKDGILIVIPSRPEEDDAWNHPETGEEA